MEAVLDHEYGSLYCTLYPPATTVVVCYSICESETLDCHTELE